MSKPVAETTEAARWSTFSQLAADGREDGLKACRLLADAVHEGLDVSREILAVDNQKLGETVLLWEGGELVGLAVCHCGPSTEAGSDTCYVKFGTVRPAKKAAEHFEHLLRACECLARRRNLPKLVAGVNMGRHRAYGKMLAAGFHTELQGVTMHRPNEVGYDRPTTYLTDDWR